MKYLIMCEGPNERQIIDILLDNNLLIFGRDDLLGLVPYHARQINASGQIRATLNMYTGNDVIILRIGDKQNEELRIPVVYKHKIQNVRKVCTKPELEVLLIIAEGMWREYHKVKSKMSAKEFAKAHIRLGTQRYNNSTVFYREYFGNYVDKLVYCIKEYRRLHKTHRADEDYLADFLSG